MIRYSPLRDELLDGEVFYSLAEAKVVIESWRRHYNTSRPRSGRSVTASDSDAMHRIPSTQP
jgi:hypothetical protein